MTIRNVLDENNKNKGLQSIFAAPYGMFVDCF